MISRDTILFLAMTLCGIGISVLYDFFRALRAVLGRNVFVTVLSDVIFCVFSALAAAACVWNFGNGAYRFYEPLGMAIGSVLYFLLISKWLIKFFSFLIKNILKILLTPMRFLYKILVVPVARHKRHIKQRSKSADV